MFSMDSSNSRRMVSMDSRSQSFYEGLKAHRFYGRGDLEAMFPDEAPTRPVPWEQAGRRKDVEDYDKVRVSALIKGPVELHDLDPRDLHAYQPAVTRAGVRHYLGSDYTLHGITHADQGKSYNQYPVVYRRDPLQPGGEHQNIILSGHHRAAAALLQGRQFRARYVEGPWGPPRGQDGPPSFERTHPRLKGL